MPVGYPSVSASVSMTLSVDLLPLLVIARGFSPDAGAQSRSSLLLELLAHAPALTYFSDATAFIHGFFKFSCVVLQNQQLSPASLLIALCASLSAIAHLLCMSPYEVVNA